MRELDLFYNTTNLSDPYLKECQIRNGSQNWIVLNFFQENPGISFTPFQVKLYTGLIRVPITSIRRAITTLTNLGFLVKTNTMREGELGAKNNTWRFR
jgi:hypothetical protein